MGGRYATTAWIAQRQHGRVAWRQLVEEGVDRHTIQRWVADGRLRPVHLGVYAVGHEAPSVEGDYMAAARRRRGRRPQPPRRRASPAPGRRCRAGARGRRADDRAPPSPGHRHPPREDPHPLDVSILDGIPITIVPRVLLDLAPSTKPAALTRACHEAWVRHDAGPKQIEACIARNPAKQGAAKLRRALGADVVLSELEQGFLRLLRAHDLPCPRTNIDHAGDKVDCRWPEHELIIELHCYRFHGTRHAFEKDVARRRRSNHVAYTHGDGSSAAWRPARICAAASQS